jgi:hypothetical protein
MGFHDMFANTQAQTTAARFPVSVGIYPVKALENSPYMFLGNPYAIVGHLYDEFGARVKNHIIGGTLIDAIFNRIIA